MITGSEKPDARHAADRRHGAARPTSTSRATRSIRRKTVWEEISDGQEQLELGKREVPCARLRRVVQLQGHRPAEAVGDLSGGERNRVHLAKLLKRGGNVLLLDEPTNDLDVDTLRALEDALLEFAGCAVVISHDRWFLDRIATHMLAFEGDSQVVWFEGNYADYEADRRRRLGADADQPHRIRYRPLTRGMSRGHERTMRVADGDAPGTYERTPPVWTGPGAPGRYFDLLHNLVTRAIKQRYKRSVLGFAWTMLNPLMTMVILTVVVLGRFSGRACRNYPLFVIIGLLAWNLFSLGSTQGLASIVDSGSLDPEGRRAEGDLPARGRRRQPGELSPSLVPLAS